MPISPHRKAYQNWHRRLGRMKGRPTVCVMCEGPADHWALKSEYHVSGELVFVEDPDAYEALCAGCHNRRDHTGLRYGKSARKNMSEAQKKAHEGRVASGAFDRFIGAAAHLKREQTRALYNESKTGADAD